jgi:fumarate reductase subunit C
MGEGHVSTSYHPRWLRRPVSTYWWLERKSYLAFILREGSCLFVGWFVVYLLLLVAAVGREPGSYAQFLDWAATPSVLALNIVSFLFIVYHAITFFEAAPQAMAVHVGRKRLPGSMVRAGHYAAWAVISAYVAWLLL